MCFNLYKKKFIFFILRFLDFRSASIFGCPTLGQTSLAWLLGLLSKVGWLLYKYQKGCVIFQKKYMLAIIRVQSPHSTVLNWKPYEGPAFEIPWRSITVASYLFWQKTAWTNHCLRSAVCLWPQWWFSMKLSTTVRAACRRPGSIPWTADCLGTGRLSGTAPL